jgi:hypothetical protein
VLPGLPSGLSYRASGGLLAGVPGGWASSLVHYALYGPRDTIDREIIVPNLLYCSNFSYYCPPTWLRRGWQSRLLPTEVRRHPFDPSNLPWAVSQCPFDPYRAGAKVYRAYQAGGRPAPQTTRPICDDKVKPR